MVLLILSFVAGVLTVLAPCILPLLPIVVGGSLTDGKVYLRKALTIVISLGLSVILFTLLLKASTFFIDIPEYTWKLLSGGILVLFGLVTLFPSLWQSNFLAKVSSRSNVLLGKGNQKKSFWGDVIVGAALGPVFSTCSPTYFIVLATVLPVNFALGMVYLLAYTTGLCLALLLVALVGQKIMGMLGVVADPKGLLKRALGAIFILVGIAVLTGFDKKIEAGVIGSGYFDVTKVEQLLIKGYIEPTAAPTEDISEPPAVVTPQIKTETETQSETLTLVAPPIVEEPVESLVVQEVKVTQQQMSEKKHATYMKAPEFSSIDGYINTDGKPVTLESLKGKVVLLSVWTYSCINCQRTLPYLNGWYAKYKDQGFEIVGLHTPEFAFENKQSNVEDAVVKEGIKYPVLLDNDYSTWKSLNNNFWPHRYLIDPEGNIIYDHIGEGAYEETEKKIVEALQAKTKGVY